MKATAGMRLADPAGNAALLQKVTSGTVTLADLAGGGASQVSPSPSCTPAFPSTFPFDGNWTAPLYAVSIPGVPPTSCVSWLMAEQACALSGKRLPTNQEWQRAAGGTPDGPPCIVSATGPGNTGTAGCVSRWGAFDMVGNVHEWVADWADLAQHCSDWTGAFGVSGSDRSCFGGAGGSGAPGNAQSFPGAMARGGYWADGVTAGIFAVTAYSIPFHSDDRTGFRCAR
jgi:formylglycine-generating enzyme required for sulfatase activity